MLNNTLILLVDDEADILEFVGYNLRKSGFDVITATNGKDGLRVRWGQGREIGTVGEAARISNHALSPDGRRVAVQMDDPRTERSDIWKHLVELGLTEGREEPVPTRTAR